MNNFFVPHDVDFRTQKRGRGCDVDFRTQKRGRGCLTWVNPGKPENLGIPNLSLNYVHQQNNTRALVGVFSKGVLFHNSSLRCVYNIHIFFRRLLRKKTCRHFRFLIFSCKKMFILKLCVKTTLNKYIPTFIF